ncbi:MAG: hypothetical protein GOMPHAMPRED_005900 [Gomphillus americanus]|uniref:Phosphoglycerate mutase n=1 Tax=Gomphillus americanus TaxID=1940652 RepID=A0A8H3G1B8_9LECA|nr:MAG: hypothetical protein GOMPHAMPRED_005900 [Gomphillus americanus]
MAAPTPRVFIIRHGETEWSLNGRHTGTSDIPLTENGEKRIRATGQALVGDDRLIVPSKIAHIYVSPRKRAQRTLELLNLGCHGRLPWNCGTNDSIEEKPGNAHVDITQDIREWDYGDYEGLTSATIREQRKENGMGSWDIWHDGCPGGESPEQVSERLDRLIADIRTRFHGPAIEGKAEKSDVVLVAHGHILRAFAMRWIGRDLQTGVSLLLETGGVGILSYEHHKLNEPAILLGGSFMTDAVQKQQGN